VRPAAAAAVCLVLLAGCSTKSVGPRKPCVNHVLHESLAPGGSTKAVTFERDCMTASTLQVSLVPADTSVANEPGNVFVIGAGQKSLYGRPVVSVAWSGPTRVTISYTKGAAVMRSEGRVGPIEVRYAFLDGTQGSAAPSVPPDRHAR
jgi:hypothetical protein